MTGNDPRDYTGYGRNPPDPRWPGGAVIAVQFVLNYEEGGENNILYGDPASEAFLSDIVGAQPWPGQRHMNMESLYEYGARAGFWRIWRLFSSHGIPITVYGIAAAMQKGPDQVAAMLEAGWEIASHGLRWIDYKDFSPEAEWAHMREAVRIHSELTGERPLGWYTGRGSAHTLELVMRDGGFLYSADSYADELPYWLEGPGGPQLIVPYTLDANDMRFATPQGFHSGEQFFQYLRDSFDELYREGIAGAPKMMSIGLHCRLVGRPGRLAGLRRFLEHIGRHERVWLARRIDIARHWLESHPPAGLRPSRMSEAIFIERFGDVFEHSPHLARSAHRAALGGDADTVEGLHRAFCAAMRAAAVAERRALIEAHPDLAGRIAAAGGLSTDSSREQASAGLARLSDDERARFTSLNSAYRARFGFPFVMAVKGKTKADILNAFESRLRHDSEQEFAQALAEIETIARFRIEDRM